MTSQGRATVPGDGPGESTSVPVRNGDPTDDEAPGLSLSDRVLEARQALDRLVMTRCVRARCGHAFQEHYVRGNRRCLAKRCACQGFAE